MGTCSVPGAYLQVRRQRRCRGHGLGHLVGIAASSPQARAQGEQLGAQSPGIGGI